MDPWLSGRRARAGLALIEPLEIPVVIAPIASMPTNPDQRGAPYAWIEEVALDAPLEAAWTRGENLVRILGTSPTIAKHKKQRVVVLCAHYDTLPGLRKGKPLYPGADDNGSGVAAVLPVLWRVAARLEAGAQPTTGLVVALTDAEEWGLIGSTALAATLARNYDIQAVINVDSVGRGLSKPTHVIGMSTHAAFAGALQASLTARGIEIGRDNRPLCLCLGIRPLALPPIGRAERVSLGQRLPRHEYPQGHLGRCRDGRRGASVKGPL